MKQKTGLPLRRLLVSLALALALVLALTAAAWADGVSYVYRSWDGTTVQEEIRTANASRLSDSTDATLRSGWYYVNTNLERKDRLVISGTVNIILCDGAKLYQKDGIQVDAGNVLNIYCQSGNTGELYCDADTNDNAAIGSNDEDKDCGTINIYGGIITADTNKKGEYGAGIGGGDATSGGNVTIFGGDIKAYGGTDAAGIGGGEGGSGGNLTIYGGSVYAKGGSKTEDGGAGIGSGEKDGKSVHAGSVKIYGGTVKAEGGPDAAGIGGGNGVSGADVEIFGGNVIANGGSYAAGIGSGDADAEGVSGGSVKIHGGEVEATGGKDAAGIGGGEGGGGANVEITGGVVTAKNSSGGSDGGAGIGSGDKDGKNIDAGTVTISGGTVTATGGGDAAGIGGGDDVSGGSVTISGGTVIATGGKLAAGIGGGENGHGGTITISGGDITATGGDNAAGIGGGEDGDSGDITISNATVNAKGGSNYNDGGAGIGSGNGGEGMNIHIISGNITATGGADAAGIGGGDSGFDVEIYGGHSGYITIDGGTVSATGGVNGAGIGGGQSGTCESVIIRGGEITATGGEDAAGIGGGDNGFGSEITIRGGTVTARGGECAAGIGGGNDELWGTITITGGNVEAHGGDLAAGIGGGDRNTSVEPDGTIIIGGSAVVKAYGGGNGAGIGGGDYTGGGNITINGGTGEATGGSKGTDHGAAGIGGGDLGYGGQINVDGGDVTAQGGAGAAGIGGGCKAKSGKIEITNGRIVANGGYPSGAGIGSGAFVGNENYVIVHISGGDIHANGGGPKYSEGTFGNHYKYEGTGIGAGGIDTVSSNGYPSVVDKDCAFRGSITISGGSVTTKLIGKAEKKATGDGTILFNGGTTQFYDNDIKNSTYKFGDHMRIDHYTVEERENNYNSVITFSTHVVTTCSHNRFDHTQIEGDYLNHSIQCITCTGYTSTESHHFSKPVWKWSEDRKSASVDVVCPDCGYTRTLEAIVNQIGDKFYASVKTTSGVFSDVADQTDYAITMEKSGHGTVSVANHALVGKTVPVAVNPDAHCHVTSVTVNGEAITPAEDGTYSFKMEKCDAKVVVNFAYDTVNVTWINRDYAYPDEGSDEPMEYKLRDKVVAVEAVPYGTVEKLPEANEFVAQHGKCGFAGWVVTKEKLGTVSMSPGVILTADEDITIVATWREHNFTYSAFGATITAECKNDGCSLVGSKYELTVVKPTLSVYGQEGENIHPEATLKLTGMNANDVINELGELENSIRYYPAEKAVIGGGYTKNGDALDSAPTEPGHYVAEITVDGVKTNRAAVTSLTAYAGYTIEKLDPTYTVPTGITAKAGEYLQDIALPQPADGSGTWTWKSPSSRVRGQKTASAYATFTPADTTYYKTVENVPITIEITDAAVTVEVEASWLPEREASSKYDSAEFTLYATNERAKDLQGNSIEDFTLNEENGWKMTFENLPRYNDRGREITYQVKLRNSGFSYELNSVSEATDDGFKVNANLCHTYDIRYVTKGGSFARNYNPPYSYTYGETLHLPIPSDMTRNGYDFAGWYEDWSASGTRVWSIGPEETGDKTFYASWTEDAYALQISKQPYGVSMYYGDSGRSLSVEVTPPAGGSYELNYQWYSCDRSGSNARRINTHLEPSAATATYQIPANLDLGTYYYYCDIFATDISRGIRLKANTRTCSVTVTAAISGVDVVLDGAMQMRFYLAVPVESLVKSAHMVLSVNGVSTSQTIDQAEYIDGKFVFSVPVSPLDMNQRISATFYNGAVTLMESMSIRRYLDSLERLPNIPEELTTLIAATRNYGHYMQAYLSQLHGFTVGEGYAYDYQAMPAASEITPLTELPEYRRVWGEHGYDADLIESMQYFDDFEANTTLNIDITLKNAPASVTAAVDGENWELVDRGNNCYRISIPNIAANNLGKPWHVELTVDGKIVYDAKLSALSYVSAVLDAHRDQPGEAEALTAFYQYYTAAKAFE